MLDLKLIAMLEQARAELIEVYPPLLMGFYKELKKQGANENTAFDLTSQLFQHYLNKESRQ
ncbi:hypothetical protein DRH27_02835 [Candidatus Falkowbacteria bacterium]|nr:MAG: hypothetical protein DRH27_02835 [Candidatus Falkowbacteria bacterium]